jgi:hypothetical protein
MVYISHHTLQDACIVSPAGTKYDAELLSKEDTGLMSHITVAVSRKQRSPVLSRPVLSCHFIVACDLRERGGKHKRVGGSKTVRSYICSEW